MSRRFWTFNAGRYLAVSAALGAFAAIALGVEGGTTTCSGVCTGTLTCAADEAACCCKARTPGAVYACVCRKSDACKNGTTEMCQ